MSQELPPNSISKPILDFISSDPLAKIIEKRKWGQVKFSLLYLGFYLLNLGLILGIYAIFWENEYTEQLEWGLRPTNLIFILIVPPLTAALYHWISNAPRQLFNDLTNSDVLKSTLVENRAKLFNTFSWIQRLFTNRGWVTASIVISLSILPIGSVLTVFGVVIAPEGTYNWVGALLLIPAGAFGLYMVCMIVARELCVIVSVRKLFREYSITLYPLHPDRCGGLRPLNQYAIKFSYIIAVFGFGLSVLVLQSYLDIESQKEISTFVTNADWFYKNIILWIAVVIYIFGAPYCFFSTLSGAHDAMQRAKNEHLQLISKRFNVAYQETQDILRQDSIKLLKDKVEDIEQFQQLYKLTDTFPVWPFDWGSIRRFSVAVFSSIIPLILTIIGMIIR